MTVAVLLILAAGLWAIAAVTGLTATHRSGMVAGCLVSALGGLACLAGGVTPMLDGRFGSWQADGAGIVGTMAVRSTPLAAAFITLLGLVAVAIGL